MQGYAVLRLAVIAAYTVAVSAYSTENSAYYTVLFSAAD